MGELARVVDGAMTLTAFLGGNNHHARHCARTIYRGGTTVLQHLERLDVVGIQTGNGVGNQRRGIAARQVVGIHVDGIFHNHAVDHPEGRGGTIDRGGTANANFRCRTEGAAHVLHAHAGGASFKRTGHVGHTVELGLLCVNLRRGTREQTLVHLLNTRHHHFVDGTGIGLQRHLHAVLRRHSLTHHAYIADDQLLAVGHVDGEMAVHVGLCSLLSALNQDGGTDTRLTAVLEHRTCNFVLSQHRPYREEQADQKHC